MKMLSKTHLAAILFLPVSVGVTFAAAPQESNTAQTPATPSTTLKVQVNEVILPVTVRDKKGQVVHVMVGYVLLYLLKVVWSLDQNHGISVCHCRRK